MEEHKKHSRKKPISFSVLVVFFCIFICGTVHSAQKSNEAEYSAEKTISSIFSVLCGNHLAVDLSKPDQNKQGENSDDDEEKKDKKTSESDPYGNNGNRTSKKKANSED